MNTIDWQQRAIAAEEKLKSIKNLNYYTQLEQDALRYKERMEHVEKVWGLEARRFDTVVAELRAAKEAAEQTKQADSATIAELRRQLSVANHFIDDLNRELGEIRERNASRRDHG